MSAMPPITLVLPTLSHPTLLSDSTSSIVFTQIGDDSQFVMDNSQTYSTPGLPKIGSSITLTIGGVWQQPADLNHISFKCYGLGDIFYEQDISAIEQVQPGGWTYKYTYDVLSSAKASTYNLTVIGMATDNS